MRAVIKPNHNLAQYTSSGERSLPPRRLSYKRLAWLVWAVSAVFLLFQFSLQLSSGEIVAGLMHSFSLSAFGGGLLASAYYYVYVTLQIPAGMLIDRYGSRRLLSLGALIAGVGCFLFAGADGVAVAAMGRLLMGAGAAFAFVGSMTLIARWFPAERFGIMVAIAEAIGMLGTIFSGYFLADVVQTLGWRDSMFGAAVIGIVIAVCLWLIVRDQPRWIAPISSQTPSRLMHNLRVLLKSKVAWRNAIYSGIMFCIVTVFVALWAVPFFQLEHHLSLMMAALTSDLMFAGMAIGVPIIGWLDSRRAHRRIILVGGAFASAIILAFLIYIPALSLAVVMALMLLLGLVSSSYVLTLVIGNEIASPEMRGTSLGFVNTFSVGTAPILQPLIGLVLVLLASHNAPGAAVLHYSVSDYQIALSILPVLLLVAAWLGWKLPARAETQLHTQK